MQGIIFRSKTRYSHKHARATQIPYRVQKGLERAKGRIRWYLPPQPPQTGDNLTKSNLQSVVPGLGTLLERQTLGLPPRNTAPNAGGGVHTVLFGFLIYLYFWLHWVFVAVCRLSLVKMGGLLIAVVSLVV